MAQRLEILTKSGDLRRGGRATKPPRLKDRRCQRHDQTTPGSAFGSGGVDGFAALPAGAYVTQVRVEDVVGAARVGEQLSSSLCTVVFEGVDGVAYQRISHQE